MTVKLLLLPKEKQKVFGVMGIKFFFLFSEKKNVPTKSCQSFCWNEETLQLLEGWYTLFL
jgi:hypothetical protein